MIWWSHYKHGRILLREKKTNERHISYGNSIDAMCYTTAFGAYALSSNSMFENSDSFQKCLKRKHERKAKIQLNGNLSID